MRSAQSCGVCLTIRITGQHSTQKMHNLPRLQTELDCVVSGIQHGTVSVVSGTCMDYNNAIA